MDECGKRASSFLFGEHIYTAMDPLLYFSVLQLQEKVQCIIGRYRAMDLCIRVLRKVIHMEVQKNI